MLGGARSGKSAHAEGLVAESARVTYLATARRIPGDADWDARITEHIARRPASWRSVETPDTDSLVSALANADPRDTLLVDDIATWLTGVIDDADGWEKRVDLTAPRDRLVTAMAGCPARLVVVSAEVGLGVIPATRSGRLFRDELGAVNASMAEVCTDVLLLVAGLPLRLK